MAPSSSQTQPIALALGSNMGDRLAALGAAIDGLSLYIKTQSISPLYETPAAYITDLPLYLNATLIGETRLSALTLLWSIKELEAELGRRPTYHYGPRLIDIDILFYGDQIIKTPELIVPHARLQEREFVLRPLADIAPDWKHPVTGKSVEEMLKALPESTAVKMRDTL